MLKLRAWLGHTMQLGRGFGCCICFQCHPYCCCTDEEVQDDKQPFYGHSAGHMEQQDLYCCLYSSSNQPICMAHCISNHSQRPGCWLSNICRDCISGKLGPYLGETLAGLFSSAAHYCHTNGHACFLEALNRCKKISQPQDLHRPDPF